MDVDSLDWYRKFTGTPLYLQENPQIGAPFCHVARNTVLLEHYCLYIIFFQMLIKSILEDP